MVSRALLLLIIFSALIASSSAQQNVPGTGFNSALELAPGTYSFFLATGEAHFFKTYLEPGDILVVKIRMAFNQDFDLYLLNPMREIVGQSVNAAGLTDSIELVVAERGHHYIVVIGFGAATGTYTLTLSVVKPKTFTTTVTATITEKVTETVTAVSFATNTVVSERLVTLVNTQTVEVDRVPWTALGLAVLAAAVVFLGYSATEAVKSFSKPSEKKNTASTAEAGSAQ